MHITSPATHRPTATPPAPKPAPSPATGSDFSQLLKTAQAGTPAAPSPSDA